MTPNQVHSMPGPDPAAIMEKLPPGSIQTGPESFAVPARVTAADCPSPADVDEAVRDGVLQPRADAMQEPMLERMKEGGA